MQGNEKIRVYRVGGNFRNALSISCLLAAAIGLLWFNTSAAQVIQTGEDGRRPCTGDISLLVDDEVRWTRPLEELRKLDDTVLFTEGRQKGKQGIPLANFLQEEADVTAVEVSTCTGKLRRFDAQELARKKDGLFFIITKYRGLKLHNAAGGEKKRKGSRLKDIDQIRLITQPE
ncbi:MAG: hypothetical protein O6931_02185 [Gammaproteobacteria bacterium]|nr:hypothetical protein [Gammaproteobacteria bacterium]